MATRTYDSPHDADLRFMRWLTRTEARKLRRYLFLLYKNQPKEYEWKVVAINRELRKRSYA